MAQPSDDISENEEEQEVYEVDQILSCRGDEKGSISYLVRWKGYDSDGDTWEPEENLTDCKDAIMKFFKDRDVMPDKSKGSLVLHLKKQYSPLQCATSHNEHEVNSLKFENKSEQKVVQTKTVSERSLRLTPQRKMRLLQNNDKFEAEKESRVGQAVTNNSFIKKEERTILSKDEESPRKAELRYRKVYEVSSNLPDLAYEISYEKDLQGGKHSGIFENVFVSIILTAGISIFLIGILYVILIYDLS